MGSNIREQLFLLVEQWDFRGLAAKPPSRIGYVRQCAIVSVGLFEEALRIPFIVSTNNSKTLRPHICRFKGANL